MLERARGIEGPGGYGGGGAGPRPRPREASKPGGGSGTGEEALAPPPQGDPLHQAVRSLADRLESLQLEMARAPVDAGPRRAFAEAQVAMANLLGAQGGAPAPTHDELGKAVASLRASVLSNHRVLDLLDPKDPGGRR